MVVKKIVFILLLVFWIISLTKLNSLFKKVCIASDHGGFNLKEIIKDHLIKKNISIIDLGPLENKTVDYPDYAKKVANRIKAKKSDVGILVCGSGTGMAISANKTKTIRKDRFLIAGRHFSILPGDYFFTFLKMIVIHT